VGRRAKARLDGDYTENWKKANVQKSEIVEKLLKGTRYKQEIERGEERKMCLLY
jgi:hypothetical protein